MTCARTGGGSCAKQFGYWVQNVPVLVSAGNEATEFRYDESNGRFFRMTSTVSPPALIGTTTYVGNSFFEEEYVAPTAGAPIAVTTWRHYIRSPEGIVAIASRASNQAVMDFRFWLVDHLGSPIRQAAYDGSLAEPESFDAWGKRRSSNATDGAPGNLVQLWGARGFTGHEHLDSVGLIHMNGRVYDPAIGRFINADPIVQSPLDTQSWNRYSYVMNNPLSLTDPSGFSWWTTWRRPIFAIAAMWVIGPGAYSFAGVTGVGEAGLLGNAFVSTVAGGFAAGGIQGGNLQSAVQGAFTATLFYGAGQFADTLGSSFDEGTIGRAAIHASAGCAGSAAAGGSAAVGHSRPALRSWPDLLFRKTISRRS